MPLKRYWLGFLIYAVCSGLLFWPVSLDILKGIPAFPQDLGDPPSQAWIIGWYTHILLSDPGRLWDANIFFPTPGVFAYQDSLLGYAPVAMPLLLVSGNLPLTYNVLFLLSFTLCGLCAFLFIRYLLHLAGCARQFIAPSALVGGLIYAFLPFKMSHLGHLNLLSAQWLPLILFYWERGWRRDGPRAWIGLGLCFVLQALCSLYYAIFAGLALLFLLVLRLRRQGVRAAPWPPLVLTGILVAVALLPFLGPYISTVRTLGQTRPLGQTVAFSPDLRDLLHTSPLSLLYGWTDRLFPPHTPSSPQYLFLGVVPLALAVIGARTLRRRRGAGQPPHMLALRPYLGVGIISGILALGPFVRIGSDRPLLPAPYLILYALVPGFQGLRDPARFMVVAGLCLGLLASWGAATLLVRLQQARPGLRSLRLAWLGLCGLVLCEYAIGPVAMPGVAAGATIPPVYRWLAGQPASTAVLELPIGNYPADLWSQQCLMMYYSTYHWRHIVNGTGGFFPPWYDRQAPVLRSFPSAPSLRLLRSWGVSYVIVHGAWTGGPSARRIAHAAAGQHLRQAGHWGDDTAYTL